MTINDKQITPFFQETLQLVTGGLNGNKDLIFLLFPMKVPMGHAQSSQKKFP